MLTPAGECLAPIPWQKYNFHFFKPVLSHSLKTERKDTSVAAVVKSWSRQFSSVLREVRSKCNNVLSERSLVKKSIGGYSSMTLNKILIYVIMDHLIQTEEF
jgi:hypothetical protein